MSQTHLATVVGVYTPPVLLVSLISIDDRAEYSMQDDERVFSIGGGVIVLFKVGESVEVLDNGDELLHGIL